MADQTSSQVSASLLSTAPAAGELSQTGRDVGLEELLKKYIPGVPRASFAQPARTAQRTTLYQAQQTRISQAPQTPGMSFTTGDVHAEMAGIQHDLADLAEVYGKLNVNFGSLIGKERMFNVGDAAAVSWYTLLRNRNKVREVKIGAARRRGELIDVLVNKMSEVLDDQYQSAVKGRDLAKSVQVENIAHMKKLDQSFIERLTSSYVGSSDLAAAEDAAKKIVQEVTEVDHVLVRYEDEVQRAKAGGDIPLVRKLAGEMTQVLNVKYGLLDGQLAADGEVSEIRRKMLESSEGVQSAKAAIAASRVNYRTINAWIDAMNELEFKYRHAKEDFIIVFKIQGKVAAGGMRALELKKTLLEVAGISQRLMEANVNLVERLTQEVFELVQTPLYDIERARACEQRIDAYMTELNQQKVRWAEAQQRISEEPSSPHYTEHR